MCAAWLACGYMFGLAAFKEGLAVKRWAVTGMVLGPLAYPLFNTHKRYANGKTLERYEAIRRF
ncbi:hypothetical protein [Shewanella maritima]|uniref:hypothetical protein n=1 Tax=Shewanella maritima TaxID=2520507 RepID=UPI0037364EA6